jgi:Mor family transcriptional regulator
MFTRSATRQAPPADEPDVIDRIYECAAAGVPKEDVRQEFGGRSVYIPCTPQMTPEKREQIVRELQCRKAAEVARQHGISVRTAYRLRKGPVRDY